MYKGVHLPLKLQHTGILSACVIFQRYSSATFFWMHFHSRNEKFGERFKDVIVITYKFFFLSFFLS